MNQDAIKEIAEILVTSAIDCMASKANCRARDILAMIAADEDMTGAARYFGEMVKLGMDATPDILSGKL